MTHGGTEARRSTDAESSRANCRSEQGNCQAEAPKPAAASQKGPLQQQKASRPKPGRLACPARPGGETQFGPTPCGPIPARNQQTNLSLTRMPHANHDRPQTVVSRATASEETPVRNEPNKLLKTKKRARETTPPDPSTQAVDTTSLIPLS